jgi:hypothetical protein
VRIDLYLASRRRKMGNDEEVVDGVQPNAHDIARPGAAVGYWDGRTHDDS